MPLLVKNGRIITATDDFKANVYAEDETITRIEADLDPASLPKDTEEIDATGKYVFPGFIDPHVHVHLPVMGNNARDDHASASRAALAGGTTTILEMICPTADDEPLAAFETWSQLAQGGCCCDYGFHLAMVRFDDLAWSQVHELLASGVVTSLKVFLAYKGLDISDADLFRLLTMAKEHGVIVTAHCENADAIEAMQRRFLAEGKTGTEYHEPSRPRAVEAAGVQRLAMFAELTGAHVYVVHTSCDAARRVGTEAQQRGVNLWVESVIPHLVLDKSWAERPDFEGAKYLMSPPLRDGAEKDRLWEALGRREIATIATDHAPFDIVGQKDLGRADFTKIPSGIPSIQERIDLVHTYGVCAGRIDLHTMVDACSTQPARIFGMYPRKGTIAVGSDADLVIYDPTHTGVFTRADSHSQVDYCAYEGLRRQGRASVVTLRGRVVARDGRFVGEPSAGRLVPRKPTHFE